jgi:hypothetical protein
VPIEVSGHGTNIRLKGSCIPIRVHSYLPVALGGRDRYGFERLKFERLDAFDEANESDQGELQCSNPVDLETENHVAKLVPTL